MEASVQARLSLHSSIYRAKRREFGGQMMLEFEAHRPVIYRVNFNQRAKS
jgi:hypothetical protein